jgi:hypothetical protein
MMRVAAGCAACLAIGALAGRMWPRASAAPAVAAPGVARCAVGLGDDDRAAIARAVARELRASATAPASPPAPAPVAQAEPEPTPPPEGDATPAAPRAPGRAASVVQAALDRGSWTDADRTAMRLALAATPDAERGEALRALARAINARRLRVEARPPF